MKAWMVTMIGVLGFAGIAAAQIRLPPNPTKGTGRTITGGGNSSVGVVPPNTKPSAPKVITYTAVSPNRIWTNVQGKAMEARLLAFSAPKNPGEGPVEIVRSGKVRFLMKATKKTTDYEVSQLSKPDQLFIKALTKAASVAPPAKAKPAQPVEKTE